MLYETVVVLRLYATPYITWWFLWLGFRLLWTLGLTWWVGFCRVLLVRAGREATSGCLRLSKRGLVARGGRWPVRGSTN